MKHTFYYKTAKWQIVLGAIFIALGTIYLIDRGSKDLFGYGYLLLGAAYFIPIVRNEWKRKAITFTDNHLILHNQQDLFNKKISIEAIDHLEIRHILIRLKLKSGKEYDIDKDQLEEGEVERMVNFLEKSNIKTA